MYLVMTRRFPLNDRGASLIEYAMIVALIALGSLGLVANVGNSTSESFQTTADSFASAEGLAEPELTPEEKWDKAQEDYKQAIADAKAQKTADIASAKADYQAALQANKSLPKSEKKAANASAKSDYNAAKKTANDTYKGAVQAAKDAKSSAKAEYKASK